MVVVEKRNSSENDGETHLNLSIMARIMRSRRLAFAAAGHCTPAISASGGGKSGSRRRPSRPILPRNDEERIESGSLRVSDGDAVKSLRPRTPPLNRSWLLGVLAGVFCCGGVAVRRKTNRKTLYVYNANQVSYCLKMIR